MIFNEILPPLLFPQFRFIFIESIGKFHSLCILIHPTLSTVHTYTCLCCTQCISLPLSFHTKFFSQEVSNLPHAHKQTHLLEDQFSGYNLLLKVPTFHESHTLLCRKQSFQTKVHAVVFSNVPEPFGSSLELVITITFVFCQKDYQNIPFS